MQNERAAADFGRDMELKLHLIERKYLIYHFARKYYDMKNFSSFLFSTHLEINVNSNNIILFRVDS